MKKMSLFNHLDNLTINKIDYDKNNDVQSKTYNNFIINRFVSMVDMYIPIANEINRFDVPKDVHYNYYKAILPKRKQYFKYIKEKKEVDQKSKDLLCEYYKCAAGELEYHLKILTTEQIQTIVDLYKHRKTV
jgi:hypothetical protein